MIELRAIDGFKINTIEAIIVKFGFNELVLVVYGDSKDSELSFSPLQALKITTIDCFDTFKYKFPSSESVPNRMFYQVVNSDWIKELAHDLREVDSDANFMNDANHYIIWDHDNFIEVIAHGFRGSSI